MRRIPLVVSRTLAIAVLGVSGCAATPGMAAETNTAGFSIDGHDTVTYPILCTQRSWLWIIETLPDSPGFTAMLETGAALTPKVMRIRDLHGFTGSSSEGNMTGTEATIEGATFTMSGTVTGSYSDRPTRAASVQYRLQAHC